jgi:transcriptional regulator with XRE-family HTH domain
MASKARKVDKRPAPAIATALRTDYGLRRATFARLVGVPQTVVKKWEEGSAAPDATTLKRIDRVGRILNRLAGVMRKSFIPTWLEQPNGVCKELGVRTPLDLLARCDYQEVESMVYYLESGVPG